MKKFILATIISLTLMSINVNYTNNIVNLDTNININNIINIY
jgi:hypothetical protein